MKHFKKILQSALILSTGFAQAVETVRSARSFSREVDYNDLAIVMVYSSREDLGDMKDIFRDTSESFKDRWYNDPIVRFIGLDAESADLAGEVERLAVTEFPTFILFKNGIVYEDARLVGFAYQSELSDFIYRYFGIYIDEIRRDREILWNESGEPVWRTSLYWYWGHPYDYFYDYYDPYFYFYPFYYHGYFYRPYLHFVYYPYGYTTTFYTHKRINKFHKGMKPTTTTAAPAAAAPTTKEQTAAAATAEATKQREREAATTAAPATKEQEAAAATAEAPVTTRKREREVTRVTEPTTTRRKRREVAARAEAPVTTRRREREVTARAEAPATRARGRARETAAAPRAAAAPSAPRAAASAPRQHAAPHARAGGSMGHRRK